jgi:hypothetical protein
VPRWPHKFTTRKSAQRRAKRQRAAGTRIEPLERRILLSVAPLTSTIPANLAITSNPEVQQNPSIAVDPLNSKHIVVSYMDQSLVTTGYEGIGVAVSEDGGTTWTDTSISLPASFSQGAANPTTVFDGQGHVFVSFMSATFLGTKPGLTNPNPSERIDGFDSNNGIFVAESDDGGLTWDTPVAVATNAFNGTDPVNFDIDPDLAIDTFKTLPDGTLNPNYGNLYETFTQLYTADEFPGDPTSMGGGAIMLAVSSNGGQTWQLRLQPQVGTGIPVTVIGPNDPYFVGEAPAGLTGQTDAQVTVGPQGDVYVNYYEFGYDGVIYSTDAGQSFDSIDIATGSAMPFNFGSYIGNAAPLSSAGGPDGAGGPTNNFRTVPVRDIIADPTRPGTLYVADAIPTENTNGAALDYGDIFFAKSTDNGVTWTSSFTVGGQPAEVLNDDNGGFPSRGGPDDVADAQAMPEMAIDSNGDLVVIWYDTRRDPNNHLLDVFGTISTDGGDSFSANFRITSTSFDANEGAFTDAEGDQDFFLGDRIGLSVVDGIAYAAWTDTRDGNQNIETASFSIANPPPAANDRFGPNNTSATATNLGTVIDRIVPRLLVPSGEAEWFQITTAATGSLTVLSSAEGSSAGAVVQLYNAAGTQVLATSTTVASGQQLVFTATAGTTFLIRAVPLGAGPGAYTLSLQSLTANLGSAVVGNLSGTLTAGDQDLYQFETGAAGTIVATLTAAAGAVGNLSLEILDPVDTDDLGNPTVLATSASVSAGQSQQVTISVKQNQRLLLSVTGISGGSGGFTLSFTNPDLFAGAATNLLFPAGDGPSQVVIADVNNDGIPDLIVSDALSNTVSVLLGNGNGTFQAPRTYAIGAMTTGNAVESLTELPTYKRGLAVADLTGNGIEDIVVTNPASGDVSVLMGLGDGTFAPQVRYDAGPAPNAVVIGDFSGNGIMDLAVLSASTGNSVLAILKGRGDGTFQAATYYITPITASDTYDNLQAADLTGNGKLDLILTGSSTQLSYVYMNNGDGTFTLGSSFVGGGPGLAVADLNGDGIPDVAEAAVANSTVSVSLGNGNGTFGAPTPYGSGETPLAIAVGNVGSQVTEMDGSVVLGPPDGELDLIVADSGISQTDFFGPAEIAVLPAIFQSGVFQNFGSPIEVAAAINPDSVAVGDLTGNDEEDIVYVDTDGVHVIFPQSTTIPLNNTLQTAQNLGVVVHTVESTLSIVPGDQNAYYTLTVPTEAVSGAGDEVIDFSGDFSSTFGSGLTMQVLNSQGQVLASGQQSQIVAAQGQVLTLHVSGVVASNGSVGAGAYTLDIDVLPQVVSVQAEPALPGLSSLVTSLVITFQGDRLDPVTAENPANYTVTWLGSNGDSPQIIPIATETDGEQSVIYDPSANIDVATGITYPTAVRQTVTLLFDQALPVGSYLIAISPNIQSAPFNDDESTVLSTEGAGVEHSVVSIADGEIAPGAEFAATNLVSNMGLSGSFDSFQTGTAFLTQLHGDLGAILDASLTAEGDQSTITPALLNQLLLQFRPSLELAGTSLPPLLVMFLDPVSLNLADPDGTRISYNLQTGDLTDNAADAYVNVADNVELVVMPVIPGQYVLNVSNVPEAGRGGVMIVGADVEESDALTDGMRAGDREFTFGIPDAAGTSPGSSSDSQSGDSTGPSVGSSIAMLFTGVLESDGGTVSPQQNGASPAAPQPGPDDFSKAEAYLPPGPAPASNDPTTRPIKSHHPTTMPAVGGAGPSPQKLPPTTQSATPANATTRPTAAASAETFSGFAAQPPVDFIPRAETSASQLAAGSGDHYVLGKTMLRTAMFFGGIWLLQSIGRQLEDRK